MPLAQITDPDLIAQLEGGEPPAQKVNNSLLSGTPVTDPQTLSLLDAPDINNMELPKLEDQMGLLNRIGKRFEDRQLEVTDTFEALDKGDIGPFQATVQTLGKAAAGGTLDVLGETLVSAGRLASAAIPDIIEEPVRQKVEEGFDALTKTDTGRLALEAINNGVGAFNDFKKEHPQFAKTIESAVNIGMLVAPVKAKKNAGPSPLSVASQKMKASADAQIGKKRSDFIQNLVSPKRTQKTLLEEVPRTQEVGRGIFKRSIVEPTGQEKLAAQELLKISNVSSRKTIQGNYNVIAGHNSKLADQLEKKLGKSQATISGVELANRIKTSIDDVVRNNPTVVGDPSLASKANRVGEKALELLSEEELTPLGILKARRKLDSWLIQNRPKVFDQAENTLSASGRAVRNALNNAVDELAPDVKVKDSLSRQSTLFNAMENIAPKAADESNFALMRAWDNAARALPVRNRLIQEGALLLGMGGLGAAAVIAPTLTKGAIAGLIVYGSKKAIMSASTKKGIGSILKAVDKAIISSENPSMIRQLRADRALIVELLKNAEIGNPDIIQDKPEEERKLDEQADEIIDQQPVSNTGQVQR